MMLEITYYSGSCIHNIFELYLSICQLRNPHDKLCNNLYIAEKSVLYRYIKFWIVKGPRCRCVRPIGDTDQGYNLGMVQFQLDQAYYHLS